jgi:hypothetical protein
MEILETGHATLTAYEVLKIVKQRERDARPYKDSRDQEHLGDYERVRHARALLLPSLLAHSPEGTELDGPDAVGAAITQFCADVQGLCQDLAPFYIWNLLSVRPRNDFELACLFPTQEEWAKISPYSDELLELIERHFPATS